MEFKVPKFIEREAKIAGPLTLKQFLFLAFGFFACIALYYLLGKNLAKTILISTPVMAIAFSFAFVQIEGRPLPTVILNFLKYNVAPKMYLWQRKEAKPLFVKKIEPKERKERREKESYFKGEKISQLAKKKGEVETSRHF